MSETQEAYVYLDYAASAPLCEEASQVLSEFYQAGVGTPRIFANPNSLHSAGRDAFSQLEHARSVLAKTLGASRTDEISFTSGATEANNAALFGLSAAAFSSRVQRGNIARSCTPRIIISAIEHDSVLRAARELEHRGFSVVYLSPSRSGKILPETLQAALTDDTVLVSIQAANSEVGSLQPIGELCALAHEAKALFHTDATAAFGKIPFNATALKVDAVSVSGHKIGAPKGIGCLYVKAHTPFTPLLFGGEQEFGRRSGTQNVPAAVAFSCAATAAISRVEADGASLAQLRNKLYEGLCTLPRVSASAFSFDAQEDFLPTIAHVLVRGYESETLILRFDNAGFAVSGGSACASHSLEPSHVLRAMGYSKDVAYGALRISFGRYTTETHIDAFLDAAKKIIV